jgi:carbon-monoxide dehydrogenase medium subunit
MNAWKHYFLAHSIEDAFTALRSSSGPAHLVAGGTDYLLELQQGHHPPVDTLVDVTCIPELNRLELRRSPSGGPDELYIGAAVPVSAVTTSLLVREHAAALSEACELIGGPQVRNAATLGGNVAHALPAADGMIALVALDARVDIAVAEDDTFHLRRAPILSLFAGPGKTTLLPGREILVGFSLAVGMQTAGSAFARVMRPQGVALPILNLAVWLRREGDCIDEIRAAVGPSGPIPCRAEALEDCLRGQRLSAGGFQQAEAAWRESLRFRSSPRRATAEYRRHLSSALLEQVVRAAFERAAAEQRAAVGQSAFVEEK